MASRSEDPRRHQISPRAPVHQRRTGRNQAVRYPAHQHHADPTVSTEVRMKAIVLLSGGIDSTTTLAVAQRDGFDVHALTFRYGQRHAHEIELTKKIAERADVAHHICEIDLR